MRLPFTNPDRKRLVGKWRLLQSADEIDTADGIEMEFFPDGRLEYRIHEGDKISIMKLTYRVSGDDILTDQPSAPREERTRFRFEDANTLLLATAESRSWFERVGS